MLSEIIMSIVSIVLMIVSTHVARKYNKLEKNKLIYNIITICVNAVEQVYNNCDGKEKYNECVKLVNQMLTKRGLKVTEAEIKILIESIVNTFNVEKQQEKE